MFTKIVSILAIIISSGVVFADDKTDANKTWIVIGLDNVIITSNRAETQELIDGQTKQHLIVTCSELQIQSTAVDGKVNMKVQCKNVAATTADVHDDTTQMNISAESMTYNSALHTVELTGNVRLKSQNFGGENFVLNAGSLRLHMNEDSIRVDATHADVQLESFPYPVPVQTGNVVRKTNALFFSASWCGPCQKMQPIVRKLKSSGYQVVTIDVDRNPKMVHRYHVTTLPQFIVLDGEAVRDRVVGVQSLDQLKRLLRADHLCPAPPPMPEAADDGAISMKPISIVACPQADCTGIQILPDVGHAGDRQSLHLDGVDIFVPATFGSNVIPGTYVIRAETNIIRTGFNPDPIQNPFGDYQPLIPELFTPPPEKDTSKRSFRFGDYYLTR